MSKDATLALQMNKGQLLFSMHTAYFAMNKQNPRWPPIPVHYINYTNCIFEKFFSHSANAISVLFSKYK